MRQIQSDPGVVEHLVLSMVRVASDAVVLSGNLGIEDQDGTVFCSWIWVAPLIWRQKNGRAILGVFNDGAPHDAA